MADEDMAVPPGSDEASPEAMPKRDLWADAQGNDSIWCKETAKAPAQEASASDAVTVASRALKDALAAVTTNTAKVAKGRKEYADMQFKLDKLLAQVAAHLAEMQCRENAISECVAELIESKTLHGKRHEEDEAAAHLLLDGIKAKADGAQALVKSLGAKVKLEPQGIPAAGTAETAPIATPQQLQQQQLLLQQAPSTPTPTTTPTTEGTIGGFADSQGAMDPIFWGDGTKDADDDDSSDADTVSGTGYEINSLDEWKERVAHWVFRSQPDDTPDLKVIEYFNVWGDEATNKVLTDSITRIRDASLQERMGEISDSHRIMGVEAAGNAQAGYDMRVSRGLYSTKKYKLLHDALLGEIDKSFIDLRKKRAEDIASGSVKEPEKARISVLSKPKGLRKTAKVAFEKVRANRTGQKGAKPVLGSSATEAMREAKDGAGA